MDAASRAELEGLRRRAFGPEPDIGDDPAALTRLIELEELAQPRTGGEPATAVDTANTGPESPSPSSGPIEGDPEPAEEPARRSRSRLGTIIAGLAAAAAIVAAVVIAQPRTEPQPAASPTPTLPAQYVFTADPNSERLMSIRLDAAFGGYIQLPAETPPPPFPSTTTLNWATYLGDYYGWDLWVAGGSGGVQDEHCILIKRSDITRARCVDEVGQRLGTLRVSLAGADIPPGELSEPLEADESIRFWWLDTGAVEVVLGSFDGD